MPFNEWAFNKSNGQSSKSFLSFSSTSVVFFFDFGDWGSAFHQGIPLCWCVCLLSTKFINSQFILNWTDVALESDLQRSGSRRLSYSISFGLFLVWYSESRLGRLIGDQAAPSRASTSTSSYQPPMVVFSTVRRSIFSSPIRPNTC